MDFQRLTIGQMAKLNHISEQTLRLYAREGLLTPHTVDGRSGYRYYHIMQSARLDMIQYMKSYGMTLKEVKEYLDRSDAKWILEMLAKQSGAIDGQIRALERSKRAIARTMENYRRYEALPKNDLIFIEYIPERRIYCYPSQRNFFETDSAGYEFMLRELKEDLIASDLPITYFCNVGTVMRRGRLLSGNFYANEVFLFVDEEIGERCELLPGGLYCCLCSDDCLDETGNARRLLAEIKERGFRLNGDYICEVILDFPVFDTESRKMFYKIQIPIQVK